MIGVIGGMGVQATATFYELLHDMQKVSNEQEYEDLCLLSIPSTPDRSTYILRKANSPKDGYMQEIGYAPKGSYSSGSGVSKNCDNREQTSASPLAHLQNAAIKLENVGSTRIAIPCVTAHYFYDEISAAVNIPVINLPVETARYISSQGFSCVGLLATDGTLQSGILSNPLNDFGVKVLAPPFEVQQILSRLILDIKLGVAVGINAINELASGLTALGAEAVILGCTELGAALQCRGGILAARNVGAAFCRPHGAIMKTVDVLEVLAKATLRI